MNCCNNTTNLINSPKQLQWHFFVLIIILMIACIVLNSIIIVVFTLETTVRNNANMFVVSLASADLVVGMISMPFWIANSSPSFDLSFYLNSIDILCCCASIFNCALLSIERALKICYPYWYTNNVTSLRLKVVILLGWIAAVLVGSMSLLRGTDPKNLPYIIFISIIIYILPVVAILISYMSIFVVVVKHVKTIQKQERPADAGTTCMGRSEVKTAWRLSVFIILFIICWTPFFIKTWIYLLNLAHPPPVYFMVVANLLPSINSVANPFLYALFNPSFRKGIVKFCKKKKETRNTIESIKKRDSLTARSSLNDCSSESRVLSTRFHPPARTDAHIELLTQQDTGCVDANDENIYSETGL